MASGSRERGRLRRAFNDFRSLIGSRREHGLDGLDGLLDLLVRHLLYAVRVLYLHLARHQKRKYFEVHARLLPRDLLNCLLAVLAEMQQQRLHELLIEQVTRAVPVAVGVARNTLPEGHGALHVGRLVLNMSKYLIRLSNTSANDHQRVRGRECKRGRLVVPTKTNQRT